MTSNPAETPFQAGGLSALADVDASWVTAALELRQPGIHVDDVAVVDVIPGSATKVRLHLTYRAGGGSLPRAMVLKAGFDDMMRQLAGDLYRNEAQFFAHVAPHLTIPLPACYYAGVHADGGSVVLLDDLVARGSSFGHIEAPLSPDRAGQIVDLLASLHAAFWGRTQAPPVTELTGAVSGQRQVVEFLLGADNWERCRSLGRFDGLPPVVHDRESVSAAILSLLDTPDREPRCLIHGDAHLGNLYFDANGEGRLLDWQAARVGSWEADVSYFLICALDPDTRRAHEAALLGRYLDTLAAQGVADPPTFDDAWRSYTRQAVYGMLGLLCTPEMQSERFARAMGARFGRAVDELGSLTTAV